MKTMMHNVGHKISEDMAIPAKEDKNKKIYPTLNISDKEFTGLKGKEVGDNMNILIECKICGMDMYHDENSKDKKTNYRLEIHKMGEEGEMKMSKAMEEMVNHRKD